MSFHSTDTVDERIALIINCRVKHIISFFFEIRDIYNNNNSAPTFPHYCPA